MGEGCGESSVGQSGNEPTWNASFTFDPEELCKEKRVGCRLGCSGTTQTCQLGAELVPPRWAAEADCRRAGGNWGDLRGTGQQEPSTGTFRRNESLERARCLVVTSALHLRALHLRALHLYISWSPRSVGPWRAPNTVRDCGVKPAGKMPQVRGRALMLISTSSSFTSQLKE